MKNFSCKIYETLSGREVGTQSEQLSVRTNEEKVSKIIQPAENGCWMSQTVNMYARYQVNPIAPFLGPVAVAAGGDHWHAEQKVWLAITRWFTNVWVFWEAWWPLGIIITHHLWTNYHTNFDRRNRTRLGLMKINPIDESYTDQYQ